MKGKHRNKNKANSGLRWLLTILVLIVVGIAAFWIAAVVKEPAEPPLMENTQTPAAPEASFGTGSMEAEVPFQPINLGYGVHLEKASAYTGIYMEDGSDELVSDVMMILVTNTGEEDIQLMNIAANCGGENYRFQMTNLPSGASAALLELDRAPMPQSGTLSAIAEEVVLFQAPMKADPDTYEIFGASGALSVKNISGEDISGDIHVYYKYKAQDVYYGGITFRVNIQGGLKAGESRQIATRHFDPDTCEVVTIDVVQTDGN